MKTLIISLIIFLAHAFDFNAPVCAKAPGTTIDCDTSIPLGWFEIAESDTNCSEQLVYLFNRIKK